MSDARPFVLRDPNCTRDGAITWGEALGFAVLSHRVPPGVSLTNDIGAFLIEALVALYPAWLPEAEALSDGAGANRAALAAIARKVAGETALFGPFVAALAVRAVTGPGDALDAFSLRTRFSECEKLLRRSYGGRRILLVAILPDALPPAAGDEDDLHGHLEGAGLSAVFCGAGARALDRLPRRTLVVPDDATGGGESEGDYATPLSGRPAPLSAAENGLEALLRACPWAVGRRWNHTITPDPTKRPYQVDLLFEAANLVVELDGSEHRAAQKYGDDRVRDRRLQRMGYQVIRFTNAEIFADRQRVADELFDFVTAAKQRNI
ncbi:MAG: DUF559 domain-containing protein [Pseudomonadota bacterium]